MQIVSYTEAAGKRNEDVLIHDPVAADGLWRCVLADGQGGRPGGGWAAKLACDVTWERIKGLDATERCSPSSVCGALGEADRAVCDDADAGFTTLTGLVIDDGWLCGASNGDGLVLLLSDGVVTNLTRFQEKKPPIGAGRADIRPFGAALDAPWTLLIATDGAWKYIGIERLQALLPEPDGQVFVDGVLQATRLAGSQELPDDFTVVRVTSAAE